MENFKYKARDRFAKSVSGVISSESKEDVAKKLKDMGYIPVSVVKSRGSKPIKLFNFSRKVSLPELSLFTRQFCSLQKAGVALISSLEAISRQLKNQYFKSIIEEINRDIKGGKSLSQGLEKHHNVFDDIYVGMVKAAEASGKLPEILERLSELLEQKINTDSQIKAATRYPIIAFCVLCVGFLIVVTFVIPRFATLYGQQNVALPLPTQILINTSVFLRRFWYLAILGAGLLFFLVRSFINSKFGRPIWDNFKLKVPVFGPLISMLLMSRFARITSVLMQSGVPILQILDLASISTGNVIISGAILNIKESITQGKGFSEPMKLSPLFPPAIVQMVSIGEESGKIDELLLSVADYYDQEAGYTIKNLSTYIEPILIFVLALMVLIMALGIFMPMWNMIKVFRP